MSHNWDPTLLNLTKWAPQSFALRDIQPNFPIGAVVDTGIGRAVPYFGPVLNLQSVHPPMNVYTHVVSATPYILDVTLGQVPAGLEIASATGYVYIATGTSTQEGPARTIQGFYSSPTSATPVSVVPREFFNQRAQMTFWSQAGSLPKSLRFGVQANFMQLLDSLNEDSEPVEINLDSLQIALRFLSKAMPLEAPQFALTESGNIYLNWYDGNFAVVGVTFKPDGRAIWSASAGDPSDSVARMAEAGERHSEKLVGILRNSAPWMFSERRSNQVGRRVAA
jgi:hypothetical protein